MALQEVKVLESEMDFHLNGYQMYLNYENFGIRSKFMSLCDSVAQDLET